MSQIQYESREMSPSEYERIQQGFDEHTRKKGVKVQDAKRFTVMAMDGNQMAGTASGLAYQDEGEYSGWFYLTDLFVEAAFRGQGIGAKLLEQIEQEVYNAGVRHAWTWTAGYEAPPFYQKQGYEIFAELENWYSDGSSRVALRKALVVDS